MAKRVAKEPIAEIEIGFKFKRSEQKASVTIETSSVSKKETSGKQELLEKSQKKTQIVSDKSKKEEKSEKSETKKQIVKDKGKKETKSVTSEVEKPIIVDSVSGGPDTETKIVETKSKKQIITKKTSGGQPGEVKVEEINISSINKGGSAAELPTTENNKSKEELKTKTEKTKTKKQVITKTTGSEQPTEVQVGEIVQNDIISTVGTSEPTKEEIIIETSKTLTPESQSQEKQKKTTTVEEQKITEETKTVRDTHEDKLKEPTNIKAKTEEIKVVSETHVSEVKPQEITVEKEKIEEIKPTGGLHEKKPEIPTAENNKSKEELKIKTETTKTKKQVITKTSGSEQPTEVKVRDIAQHDITQTVGTSEPTKEEIIIETSETLTPESQSQEKQQKTTTVEEHKITETKTVRDTHEDKLKEPTNIKEKAEEIKIVSDTHVSEVKPQEITVEKEKIEEIKPNGDLHEKKPEQTTVTEKKDEEIKIAEDTQVETAIDTASIVAKTAIETETTVSALPVESMPKPAQSQEAVSSLESHIEKISTVSQSQVNTEETTVQTPVTKTEITEVKKISTEQPVIEEKSRDLQIEDVQKTKVEQKKVAETETEGEEEEEELPVAKKAPLLKQVDVPQDAPAVSVGQLAESAPAPDHTPVQPPAVQKQRTSEEEEEEEDEEDQPVIKPTSGFKLVSIPGASQAGEAELSQQLTSHDITKETRVVEQKETVITRQEGEGKEQSTSQTEQELIELLARKATEDALEVASKMPEIANQLTSIETNQKRQTTVQESRMNQQVEKPTPNALPSQKFAPKQVVLSQDFTKEEQFQKKTATLTPQAQTKTNVVPDDEANENIPPRTEPPKLHEREPDSKPAIGASALHTEMKQPTHAMKPTWKPVQERPPPDVLPPPKVYPGEWEPEHETMAHLPQMRATFQPGSLGDVWPPPEQSRQGRHRSPIGHLARLNPNAWIQQESVTQKQMRFGAPWTRSLYQQSRMSQQQTWQQPAPLELPGTVGVLDRQWPPRTEYATTAQYTYTETGGPQRLPQSAGQWPRSAQETVEAQQRQLPQKQYQFEAQQRQLPQEQHQFEAQQRQLPQEQHQFEAPQRQLPQEQHQFEAQQRQLPQEQHQFEAQQRQLPQEQPPAQPHIMQRTTTTTRTTTAPRPISPTPLSPKQKRFPEPQGVQGSRFQWPVQEPSEYTQTEGQVVSQVSPGQTDRDSYRMERTTMSAQQYGPVYSQPKQHGPRSTNGPPLVEQKAPQAQAFQPRWRQQQQTMKTQQLVGAPEPPPKPVRAAFAEQPPGQTQTQSYSTRQTQQTVYQDGQTMPVQTWTSINPQQFSPGGRQPSPQIWSPPSPQQISPGQQQHFVQQHQTTVRYGSPGRAPQQWHPATQY